MEKHLEEFCKSIINDSSEKGMGYYNLLEEILSDKIGDREAIVYFIKNNIRSELDNDQLEDLVYSVIDGDYEEAAELLDIDINSLSDIENNRDKWESTDFADEFEERIEELTEDEDDDEW